MNRGFSRAALVACGVLAAFPASAASSFRTTPPVISGKYYEQNGSASCTDVNGCQITFSKLPADKALTIERITCSVEVHSTPLRNASLVVFRSASQNFERPLHLAPSLTSEDSFNGIPVFFFSVNQTMRYPMGGNSPKVAFFQTAGTDDSAFFISCQIAGTLSP